MEYTDFLFDINAYEQITKKEYQSLEEIYGKEELKDFFEMYLNDESIDDKEKRIKTKYYKSKFSENNNSDHYFEEHLKNYLKEISKYPLLTVEEEKNLFIKLKKLEKIVQTNKISEESIKKDYKRFGLNNIKECEIYLEQLLKEENKNKEIINDLRKIINNRKIYNLYKQIKEKIITSNLRLVVPIAKNFISKGIDFMELIEEGNIGLDKAIGKFDLEKECKFSTYATYWVRQNIQRFVAENGRPIRVPANIYELIIKINSIERYLEKKLCRKASNQEVIEELELRAKNKLISIGIDNPSEEKIKKLAKIDENRLIKIKEINKEIISLYNLIGDDKDTYLMDVIADESQISVEDEALNSFQIDEVKEMLEKLKPREKIIIVLRFGLNLKKYFTLEEFNNIVKNYIENSTIDSEKEISNKVINLYQDLSKQLRRKTLEEVGSIFGLTRERIRQIEARALRKMRNKDLTVKKLSKNNV